MPDETSGNAEMFRSEVAEALHAHWKLFLIQGAIMMALGLVAVALPYIATVATEILVGWLFFVGGLFRTLTVLKARRAPGFWFSLLTAVLALLLGLILIAQPSQGVLTLTIIMMVIFASEGLAAILMAINIRQHLRNWGWTLFGGLINLLLAYLIWRGWPATAEWAIGLLIGINMFVLGLSLVITALAARAAGPR